MKKYLLSFGLIIAFAFYVILTNRGSTQIVATNPPAASTGGTAGTSVAQKNSNGSAAGNAPGSSENESEGGEGEGGITQTPAPSPTPAPAPAPAPAPTPTPTTQPASGGQYKNGNYTGPVADAFYGPMQVQAVIQGGKLANVQILQYPTDRGTSREINGMALPQLVQEAVQAQSANVDIVSGATQSSEAFMQSLASALSKAKA